MVRRDDRFATVWDAFSAGNFCILLNLILFQSFGFISLPWYAILIPVVVQIGFIFTVLMVIMSAFLAGFVAKSFKKNA